MPIGIGIEGGSTYQVARERISGLTQDEALESLHKIKTQLSQPGHDNGVLTLHNRSNDGSEMTLQRKSGLQLVFQDDRLNDTRVALRTLLEKAGLDGAVEELNGYLDGQGGSKNRIESSRMLAILVDHLQAPQTGTSLEDLYTKAGIGAGEDLGTGTFGTARLVTIGGQECVLKEFNHPQTLSLERSGTPNEAMGSYLSSKRDQNYLRDTVKVAQPSLYVISMDKDDGTREFRMVKPHAMRMLVKQAMRTGSEVQCHGIVMPKATGTEGAKLITEGTLNGLQKKQYIGSMLKSVQGLNARGFVHRDIKPENSYFDRVSGTTTLIDTGSLFKSSKNQEKHPGSEYIEGGQRAGTEHYMHPRVARLQDGQVQRHGTEADLYAVGVSALQVDHPLAFEHLKDDILNRNYNNEGITPDWLRATLTLKINQNPEPPELLNDLNALLNDIDNQDTLSGFAMSCFQQAGLPVESWQNRGVAQPRYTELLGHPALLD